MDSCIKRLFKELNDNRKELNPCVLELEPVDEDDLLVWKCSLKGPQGTPYEGGVFKLQINITENYPLKPPTFKFLTPICHPNVHFKSGEICLDILKTEWSPAWTLSSTMTAISLLLTHPEPSSPLNCDAANLLRCNDNTGYNSLVKMYTQLYATHLEQN
ncbi:ubiquitin-conjugating enzyme [Conidiobolus coronatus NRRL 28638]|uniref:Ubiquitin-conjugating enzyme n=1 Tax=Conidiobolus coronatus (strain ATCC 28846 / CBS 209.66 / NRRL 28638) TaxID=796925 RepID=A0A137PCZ0_CONC2|nr:ubiquitin-conjugating enzyme [Conidiobolus coronatus NRRL 28638]|eukprot:KXN72866.1 ubiquitin-conjugating enzyme [Conidiobolus coronatus NRRL 28638]